MKMTESLLSQKTVVERYLSQSPRALSPCSFVNIFAWQDFFHFDFKILSGSLCVFASSAAGCFQYLPPLGKNISAAVIDACFRIMEDANRGSGVTRIENVSLGELPLFPVGKFEHYKKGYEYCYYREDIASLRGNLYKSKRSSYNQFAGKGPFSYVPYEEGMLGECLTLYNGWADARKEKQPGQDIYCSMLDENRKVHETVLRHYRDLDLIGRVVVINGKVEAYTIGFAVNPQMFCVLFEVANLDIKGLATYIFRELCRDADVVRYKFINGMDDFEMENIRETKMSFHPCALLPLYVVTRDIV